MNYFQILGTGFRAFFGEKKSREALLKEKKNLVAYGFLTLAISGALAGIFTFLKEQLISLIGFGAEGITGLSFIAIFGISVGAQIVISIIICSFTHLIAKLFKGKGSWTEYFGTITVGSGLVGMILAFTAQIPILGGLISLALGVFSIMFNYYVIKEVYQLSSKSAGWTVAIPIIVGVVIAIIGVVLIMTFAVGSAMAML